ncbi:MAG: hypothetical protein LBT39_00365, partial [Treponema sp.]|nr:hypothetical protein [Treponema sp.]
MLFESASLKGKKLKNRIVFPPVLCFGWSKGGELSPYHLDHYEGVAKGGAGLIIIEAACVHPEGRLHESQLGIWSDEFIDGFAEAAKRSHREGVPLLVQIHHGGIASILDKAVVPWDVD